MSDKTGIEWTDATWNPIRGCSRVSEGCRNCYAESVARRFSGPGLPYEGLVRIGGDGKPHEWNGNIKFVEEHLLDPLRWTKPRKIFVNSMSDLFHPNVTDEMLDRIFAVMALASWHTFQVLTKRPERMREYLTAHGRTTRVYNHAACIIEGEWSRMSPQMAHHRSSGEGWWPLPNVWMGTSAEDQKTADERIPHLLQTPAWHHFISAEPLLGAVHLRPEWLNVGSIEVKMDAALYDSLGEDGRARYVQKLQDEATRSGFNQLDWVIAGGESGRRARPMRPDWARSLRDQCAAAGVPFFFKQWGEWAPAWGAATHILSQKGELVEATHEDPRAWQLRTHEAIRRVGKKAAGHMLDGVEHHAFPAVRV